MDKNYGIMLSKEKILEALTGIVHPDKGRDIVSMGMVSEISVDKDGISLILTPEKSNDPFISSLKSTIVKKLKDVFGADTVINEIKVEPKMIIGKQKEKERPVLPGVMNIVADS